MAGYVRQFVIHGFIPESSERAFLNAGKECTLFRACFQVVVR